MKLFNVVYSLVLIGMISSASGATRDRLTNDVISQSEGINP